MEDYQKRELYRQENRFIRCQEYIAEVIRKHDSNAEAVAGRMVDIQDPIKDLETFSLLRDGMLSCPISDLDPGRGMSRLQMVWKVWGKVNGQPGVYPAYQVELLVAEFTFNYVSLEKRRMGTEWVSPILD